MKCVSDGVLGSSIIRKGVVATFMCDDPATGGYSTRDEGLSKPGWPEGKLEGYVQVSQNSTSDSHTSRQCCIEEGFKRFFLETLIRNRGKN